MMKREKQEEDSVDQGHGEKNKIRRFENKLVYLQEWSCKFERISHKFAR